MARTQARSVLSGFPFGALARPLTRAERRRVELYLRQLLGWQRSLSRWPSARGGGFPDATPFVSLYGAGRLLGCYGSPEGAPAERLARAFLLAAHDGRYPSPAGLRDALAVEVAYPLQAKRLSLPALEKRVEVGRHAIGCVRRGALPVLLLPAAARDGGLDATRSLALVAQKAGTTLAGLAHSSLFLCDVERVVVRSHAGPAPRPASATTLAADWLSQRVSATGRVEFGCDPRSGQRAVSGEFHHGRAAVVIRALAEHGGHPRSVRRARQWLGREIAAALARRPVAAWPEHPAAVAGTLALSLLGGVDVRRELAEVAGLAAVRSNAWHAAQVVTALGSAAPPALWKACVVDLERNPWAPWTHMAAEKLGDAAVLARTTRALVASVRRAPPHRGAVAPTSMPELALTAVVVEALATTGGRAAARAVGDAQDFLRRWQLVDPIAAAFEPELARGAFPLAPIAPLLRSDVTAHALRALLVAVE